MRYMIRPHDSTVDVVDSDSTPEPVSLRRRSQDEESLLSIRRAGASIILTYYAKDAAKLLA